MIPDDSIEEVRAGADIVGIIGEFVTLKKAGREYKGLSPFTDEKTPSFCVIPHKGFWHCFSSGRSGDVFSFVMDRLGLGFLDAVRYVAERSGITVREVERADRAEDPNRPLYEANAFARTFFIEQLADPKVGATARAYLERRGISPETAERFGLGYAPDEWRALREAAGKHGFDDELLLAVGLLTTSDKNPDPYDRFRNRIVFPIESVTGRTVGFGGRILDTEGKGRPKYLNSPETPIYHKGEVLYGLSWAKNKIRRAESALVVEGYMDAVALADAGLDHVVATLGTAMTAEHVKLLSRYCTQAQLLFDSDAAGLRATFKAGDQLLAGGMHPSVVTLPDGEDPDTIVRTQGEEALRTYVDQAVDVLDRKLQILDERDFFSTIEGARKAVDRLLPTLRAAKDPTLRDIYIDRVSQKTGVRRETLEQEAERAGETRAPVSRPQRSGGEWAGRRRTVPGPRMGAERRLLRVLLKNRSWIEEAMERIGPSHFDDSAYREIFEALAHDTTLTVAPPGMAPDAERRLDELLADEEEVGHGRREFDAAVGKLLARELDRRFQELQARLSETDDDAARTELLVELDRLRKENRAITSDWRSATRNRHPPDGA